LREDATEQVVERGGHLTGLELGVGVGVALTQSRW
jgi:hypothetical protein